MRKRSDGQIGKRIVATVAIASVLGTGLIGTTAANASPMQTVRGEASQASFSVSGRVILPAGTVTNDVKVYAQSVENWNKQDFNGRIYGTYDRSNGTFHINGLRPDHYKVVAYVGSAATITDQVVSSQNVHSDLSIPAMGTMSGKVILPFRFYDAPASENDWDQGNSAYRATIQNLDTGEFLKQTIHHGIGYWDSQEMDLDASTPAGHYRVTVKAADPKNGATKTLSRDVTLRPGEDYCFDFILNFDQFSDVPSGSEFRADIQWLADRGVSVGWSNGDGKAQFRPFAATTRDAFVEFLYRLAGQPSVVVPKKSPFKDVDSENEHYRAIVWAYQAGIVKGWSDGGFHPYDSVQRDAVATFLKRYAQYKGVNTNVSNSKSFKDVSAGNEHRDSISWLASTGITTGYPDGTYQPNKPITRDAIAAFLHRYDTKYPAK